MKFNLSLLFVLLCALMITSAGCNDGETVTAGGSEVVIQEPGDPTDPGNTVRQPVSGSNPPDPDQGLYSHLYYLDESQPHYGSAQDYIDQGHPVNLDLFFSQLYVPTRMFDQGFYTQSGTLLTTPSGDTL